MTLIKFNIENKTKDQRKKEVLNKLRKIQSMVESDGNYTEMVYHIISNASLQKKNMKVNLDHYGNYSVIDANNKIVSGGMFNSNEGNASVQTPPITQKQPNPTISNNQKMNMTIQKKKQLEKQYNNSSHTTETNSAIKKNASEGTEDTAKGLDNNSKPKKEEPGLFGTLVSSLTSTPAKDKVQTGTESAAANASETESTEIGAQGEAAKASETVGTDTGTESAAAKASEATGQTMTPEKKTGLFGLPTFWGGKNKTMDNESFPSFHTTVFNEGGDDLFMEHMKNMSNKKYLRSLNTQELKDIMKSNHMKVTHNGSYYNKEQMVNKVYQFYK